MSQKRRLQINSFFTF